MSIESSSGAGKVQLPAAPREPEIADLLAAAREINNRKRPDPLFVHDLLGETYDEANSVRRKLMQRIHPDRTATLSLTPAERAELQSACGRVSEAWAPIAKSKAVPTPADVELAERNNGFANDVIIMAATFAEGGLRAVRPVVSDLFEAGKSLFTRGWANAIKRGGATKDTEA